MRRLRRKSGKLPVSFFAFQDIITALAGVILILVLLTLYQRSRAIPVTADQTDDAVSLSRYQALQQQIQQRQSNLAHSHRQLDDLRKNFQTDRIREENLRRRRELAATLPAMEKLVQQRQKHIELLQKQHEELRKQQQKYSAAELTQLRKKFTGQLNENLTYQVQSTTGKKVLLLELARRRWYFAADEKKLSYEPPQAMNLLLEELKKFPSDQVHLIIAVRPSAGSFAESTKNHLLQNFPAIEITAEPLIGENFGGLTL